jgi:hypothetical protein
LHKPRIYIDTSVIGGCFDDEFKEWSNKLFNDFIIGYRIAVISDITLEELENAPAYVRQNLNNIPNINKEYIELDDEAKELSFNYLKEGIVTNKSLIDTRHIAIASVHKVDILASWNFKHIVNYNKIMLYNSINLKLGYSYIEIRSPRDLSDEN